MRLVYIGMIIVGMTGIINLTYCHDKTLDQKFAASEKRLSDCNDDAELKRDSQIELLTYQRDNEFISWNDLELSTQYINFLEERAVSKCTATYKAETAKIIHEY